MPQTDPSEEAPLREFCLCIQDIPEGSNVQSGSNGISTAMYCLAKKREKQSFLNPLDGWFLVHRTIDNVEDLSTIENLDQYKDYEVDLGRMNSRFANEYKRVMWDEKRWQPWLKQWVNTMGKVIKGED